MQFFILRICFNEWEKEVRNLNVNVNGQHVPVLLMVRKNKQKNNDLIRAKIKEKQKF